MVRTCRECPNVLYDRSMMAELTFTEKRGWVTSPYVSVQAVRRGNGGKVFAKPFQLEVDSKLHFLCVDSDSVVMVKVVQVARVILSRPT